MRCFYNCFYNECLYNDVLKNRLRCLFSIPPLSRHDGQEVLSPVGWNVTRMYDAREDCIFTFF